MLFAWFMEQLRALLSAENDVDSVRKIVIESDYEFNAPLSK